jgi:hypothetical protein
MRKGYGEANDKDLQKWLPDERSAKEKYVAPQLRLFQTARVHACTLLACLTLFRHRLTDRTHRPRHAHPLQRHDERRPPHGGSGGCAQHIARSTAHRSGKHREHNRPDAQKIALRPRRAASSRTSPALSQNAVQIPNHLRSSGSRHLAPKTWSPTVTQATGCRGGRVGGQSIGIGARLLVS